MRENEWLAGRSPALRLALATCVLAPDDWRDRQEDSIRAICAEGPNWTEFLQLVDRHRTPALSWAALKRVQGLEIPAKIATDLQKRSDECRIQALLHFQMLINILKGFDRNGISAMPLKGPLLSLEIYGDVGLRQSKDLDIAVRLENLPEAEKCLRAMGWARTREDASLSKRQWEFCVLHEYHLTYLQPGQHSQLELHWSTSWDTAALTARRWARSIQSEWNGCRYRAMSPIDLVLFLCNHGCDHAWTRAKWLGDLVRITMAAKVDWNEVMAEARIQRQERTILLCLRLLTEIFGIPLPDEVVQEVGALPSGLLDKSRRELSHDVDYPSRDSLSRLGENLRSAGYRRQLRPYRPIRKSFVEFAICRFDFNVLQLPDRLFWLYAPLRPFLWTWRQMGKRGSR